MLSQTLFHKHCINITDIMASKKNYKRILRIHNSSSDEENEPVPLQPIDESSSEETPMASRKSNNAHLKTATKRNKFECPVCGKFVVHLPRHVRNVHGISERKARHINLLYNQRHKTNRKGKRKAKQKDYHKREKCPVDGCFAVIKRVGRHLSTFHRMKKLEQLRRFGASSKDKEITEEHVDDPMSSDTSELETPQLSTTRPISSPQLSTTRPISPPHEDNERTSSEDEYAEQAPAKNRKNDSPPKPLKSVLRDFSKYLESPMGQELEASTITQHIVQISNLIKYARCKNYRKLFQAAIINKALVALRKPKRRGGKSLSNRTCRGYLSSMQHLIRFWKAHPDYDSFISATDINALVVQLSDLSKGLKKSCQRERWNKHLKEVARLPSNEDASRYINSDLRLKLIKKLNECNHETKFSADEITLINGMLFIELCMDNANRTGELSLMTVDHIYKGKIDDDGDLTVSISDHKTYNQHGPAIMNIRAPVLQLLTSYIRFIRPSIQEKKLKKVFFKLNATELSSYSMRYYMQKMWRRCGLTSEAGPTLMRKFTVTTIHLRFPEHKKALASKMNHSEATASRYYFTHDKERNSRTLSKSLRIMLTNLDNNNEQNEPSTTQTSKLALSVHSTKSLPSPSELNLSTANSAPEQPKDPNGASNESSDTFQEISVVSSQDIEDPQGSECVAGPSHEVLQDSSTIVATGVEVSQSPVAVNDEQSDHDDNDGESSVVESLARIKGFCSSDNSSYKESSISSDNSIRNHFTEEEEQHLISIFKHTILKPAAVMRQPVITSALYKTSLGRSMLEKFSFAKIKNKLNFLKYRRLRK